ncbi:MAG: hypothetical protein KDD99_05715 [Bacteroidetes bacterium]|nr:hypothetical protein [Bacteroidota bacterium]
MKTNPLHIIIIALLAIIPYSLVAGHPNPAKKLPAGSGILVETNSLISTEFDCEGNPFMATVAKDVYHKGNLVIPAGTAVRGHITEAVRAGRLSRRARLTMELTHIYSQYGWAPLETDRFSINGKKARTGMKVGGGAVLGAVLGGKRGARNGAIIGLGVAALTKGKQIEIPAGTEIEFHLAEPIKVKKAKKIKNQSYRRV